MTEPTKAGAEIKHLIGIGMSGGNNNIEPAKVKSRAPMTEAQFRDWRRRTIAELISLPAICPVRACRRSRRCKADEAVCLTHHQDKAAARISLVMGFHVADFFDEEQDDLSW